MSITLLALNSSEFNVIVVLIKRIMMPKTISRFFPIIFQKQGTGLSLYAYTAPTQSESEAY